jgi:hypothetical protein
MNIDVNAFSPLPSKGGVNRLCLLLSVTFGLIPSLHARPFQFVQFGWEKPLFIYARILLKQSSTFLVLLVFIGFLKFLSLNRDFNLPLLI